MKWLILVFVLTGAGVIFWGYTQSLTQSADLQPDTPIIIEEDSRQQQLTEEAAVPIVNSHYEPVTSAHLTLPAVETIPLPNLGNASVSWGAIGRDNQGRIYIGFSDSISPQRSAVVMELDTTTGETYVVGDAITQLKKAGYTDPAIQQANIHSKFFQAKDGYVYFASYDEEGYKKPQNKKWGGHLWRKQPGSQEWEHMLETKEALLALASDGRFIYALGYWGAVLYQFDTVTKEVVKREVGSVPYHITRNILIDERGHVFVPKVTKEDSGEIRAQLIEFDSTMNVVWSHDFPQYVKENMPKFRGIVGFTQMRNGDIYFTLGFGQLLKLDLAREGAGKLVSLGYLHPEGEARIPSLYTINGTHFLVGAARRKGKPYWIIYEKDSGLSTAEVIPQLNKFLFFGTYTKDDLGNFYLVGEDKSNAYRASPKVVKISYPDITGDQ